MPATGCCPWLCCGKAPAEDAPSPVLATKVTALSNGTELRSLPAAHSGSNAREGPVKQAETPLNNCLPSNGHQRRVVREPVAAPGRLQSERLQRSTAPTPPAGDVTASVAAGEPPALELPPVDPIICRRLEKLRTQDPLDVVNDISPPGGQRGSVSTLRFAHGFYRGDQQWLSETLKMVERAVQLDELLPVDRSVRYSSSVVDLADIMGQVREIPVESYSNKKDLEKLLTDVCRCCTYYAEEILKRTAYESDSLEVKQMQHLCVSVSNMEQARAFLVQQLAELSLDDVAARSSEPEEVEALQERLADTIEDTANTLAVHLCARIDFIARKVVCGVRRALLDPQQLGGEREAWLRHMDDTLAVLYARLRPRHLCRLLDVAWDSFRPAVRQAVDDHLYEPASWFQRLHEECEQLVSFVSRADDRCAEEGCGPASRVRAEVSALLQPYTQDGHQLLHTLRLRRNQQLAASGDAGEGSGASDGGSASGSGAEDVLGKLGVRALRAQPDADGYTPLCVQIMHAAHLHPTLSKKIYVKLKFSPKERFKKVEKCKTEPCKKDVPLFQSVFTVRLPPVKEDVLLMFVVKKVKKINAKRLAGKKRKRTLAVAYLPLSDVEVGDNQNDRAALERMIITYLPLGEPGKTDPEIVKILERRKQSKKTKKILKKDIRIV
ncbi:protein unc-13 homolog 4B-like [Schistocerca serialis cubense]|uniref:protein unc-13 homolog 4B-like n=1 Tax=Schistocerca serialis cubense TaxID=2023355 RepID=UPI00214EF4D1|nr:protein unc-13 homolog 4B-like [Schistocerca serialis cubense]